MYSMPALAMLPSVIAVIARSRSKSCAANDSAGSSTSAAFMDSKMLPSPRCGTFCRPPLSTAMAATALRFFDVTPNHANEAMPSGTVSQVKH